LPQVFLEAVRKKNFHPLMLKEVGLFTQKGAPFFHERVMFPILDGIGHTIGFSGRKMREEAYGPKYINTQETPLFKKSEVLFGLFESRKRIAKERKVIVVEGQIDALRLIQEGYNFTVAGQGTAFGAGQVRQLVQLGINQVYLALDGDEAGRAASVKVGNLFQKEGIAVKIVQMPEGADPDLLLKEKGPPAFGELLEKGIVYLNFVYSELCKRIDPNTPSGKSEIVQMLAKQIREWDHPLMVHETLRKLATLTEVPEKLIGVETNEAQVFIQQVGTLGKTHIDPDRVLETDLLRWLFFSGETDEDLVNLAKKHLEPIHFQTAVCQRVFATYIEHGPCDLLTLATKLDNPEDQLFLSEILQKRINPARARDGIVNTVQKILEREWMRGREEIRRKIQQGGCSEEEMLSLAKDFDALRANRPMVSL
jgi:DNA primase